MNVVIPPPLHSYTRGRSLVEGSGATLADVLAGLETRYPGVRFRLIDEQNRIRQHIRIFIKGRQAATLDEAIGPEDEVQIVCALSGG